MKLIAVAGIIGVGKTTLARKLAEKYNAQLIQEQYDQNPFLAPQFAGDKGVALPCELFFLMSRAAQLNCAELDKHKVSVSDYIFDKNRIFAQITLNQQDFDTFDKAERSVKNYITQPDIAIYLHDSIDNCLNRIKNRGRGFEQNICPHWLAQLNKAYENFFENYNKPRIYIDCAKFDVRNDTDVQTIKTLIDNKQSW